MNLQSLTASNTTAQSSTSGRDAWEKRMEKQRQNLQEGLQRLRAMPSPKEAAKARAESRAEQLKERIKQLRAMLIGLPPEQAKAILRQITAIAKELASLAKAAGGDSGGAGAGVSAQVKQSGGTTSETTGETAGSSAAANSAAASVTTGNNTANTGNSDTEQPEDGNSKDSAQPASESAPTGKGAGNAKSLRDKLQELAKQLKALLELVKAKMRDARQQEKDEVKQAENALHQVDSALNGGNDLYSKLGAAAGIAPTLTMASVGNIPSVAGAGLGAGSISVQA